ncbi:MAG TPA: DnaD domain protein [Phototrophicaceae bacterium]|jgi:DnaD/phage-associated family protein|nr:DnaD domain protein [Phototrophicaceae bacterium]
MEKVDRFDGFPNGKTRLIALPSEVFSELLPLIDNLEELKLTLFVLWALQQKDRDEYRYLRQSDFTAPTVAAMHGLWDETLTIALQRCVERGTLLAARVLLGSEYEMLYFANSPAGRSAVQQIETGAWLPGDQDNPVQVLPERPSVYRLYEENIGALTPLIAQDLKDIEAEFGIEWLTEAITISVQMEKRSLRYIQAILKRWKKEGKHEISEGNLRGDSQRSLTGKYADFFDR